jgi:hypothetical protein
MNNALMDSLKYILQQRSKNCPGLIMCQGEGNGWGIKRENEGQGKEAPKLRIITYHNLN